MIDLLRNIGITSMNKEIHRNPRSSTTIFDHRTLARDYATIIPLLREGMHVLDVGCGTGAISKGIAEHVGVTGHVTGIDNTQAFVTSGKKTYGGVTNLTLYHADLFRFNPEGKFDLVIAARVLQWMSNPKEALLRLSSFVKPGGHLSVLDYNHEELELKPEPPESMRLFLKSFLRWRANAGMDNRMAENLPGYFSDIGFQSVEVIPANEVYRKGDSDFFERAGIWSKVAELKQIADEGFISDDVRIQAMSEYKDWVRTKAQLMIMKLNEVRAKKPM